MRRLLIAALVCGLVALSLNTALAAPKVVGKAVEYKADGVVMKGYLAYDERMQGKRPGVIVVHEWWGLNEYAKKRARMLAQLGYTALAVDMYGDGKTAAHPDDAGKFSSEVMKNFDLGKARFNAAMDFLKQQPTVDPSRIAAIGYCFGGAVVLNMARQGADLRGVVSFHGNLSAVKPAEPGSVKAKVLVFNGADDPMTTADQIAAFKAEMKKAGVDYKFVNFPGAKHSFTNPEADEYAKRFNFSALAYNAEADKKSWAEMKKFLKAIFKE
ncbi:MAG: dienelactone hydrolase family protein [Chloroflexota bacterium]